MRKNKTLSITLAGLAALSTGLLAGQVEAKKSEKCYGIAKKKQNDCGNVRHACAAQAERYPIDLKMRY